MAIKQYITYDNTTGEITNIFRVDDTFPTAISDLDYNVPLNNTLILSDIDDNIPLLYYPSGVKTDRPTFTSVSSWNHTYAKADGSSLLTLGSSLPSYTKCTIATPVSVDSPGSTDITTGSVSVSSTVEGPYEIFLTGFPYVDYRETIIFVSGDVTYIDVPNVVFLFTTVAPSIAVTQNNVAAVDSSVSIEMISIMPDVIVNNLISPSSIGLSLTVEAATILNTAHNWIDVSSAVSIGFTALAPSVVSTDAKTISVDVVVIQISELTPSVIASDINPQLITILSSLSTPITFNAPVISKTNNITINIDSSQQIASTWNVPTIAITQNSLVKSPYVEINMTYWEPIITNV